MARINRKLQKIFARDAANNGQFGSAQLGTKILSTDLDVLQALPAWFTGWLSATIDSKRFPTLEEFQAISYVTTSQISYLFQEGIPEYLSTETYYTNSIVKKPGTYELYGSKINNNTGNALPVGISDANWQFLVDLSLNNKIPYGVATGVANAYLVTTAPVFSTWYDGLFFTAKIPVTNTGATQFNVNSIGLVDVIAKGAALVGGEMQANTDYVFMYDSTAAKIQLIGSSTVFASGAEVIAGTEANKSISPLTLQSLTATLTRRGIVELATGAEVIAGTDPDRAISPLALQSLTSLTTRIGLIALATAAEVQAGIEATKAITAATLASLTALTTRAGLIALATLAEVRAGIEATKAITSATLKSALGFSNYFESPITAWAFGSSYDFAHGLGGLPKFAIGELICVTSQYGYSVGDRVVCTSWIYMSSQNYGSTVTYNTTTLTFTIGTTGYYISSKDGASKGLLTAANWRFQVRAWG